MALDLLDEAGFDGKVQRRYRHDAESFAWCLIYICVCMGEDPKRRICTVNPHPLSSWFGNVDTYRAKRNSAEFNGRLPLHERTKPLAKALYIHWVNRLAAQETAGLWGVGDCELGALANTLAELILPAKTGPQTKGPYKELSDSESFRELLQVIVGVSSVIPHIHIFIGQIKTVFELYPYLRLTLDVPRQHPILYNNKGGGFPH